VVWILPLSPPSLFCGRRNRELHPGFSLLPPRIMENRSATPFLRIQRSRSRASSSPPFFSLSEGGLLLLGFSFFFQWVSKRRRQAHSSFFFFFLYGDTESKTCVTRFFPPLFPFCGGDRQSSFSLFLEERKRERPRNRVSCVPPRQNSGRVEDGRNSRSSLFFFFFFFPLFFFFSFLPLVSLSHDLSWCGGWTPLSLFPSLKKRRSEVLFEFSVRHTPPLILFPFFLPEGIEPPDYSGRTPPPSFLPILCKNT